MNVNVRADFPPSSHFKMKRPILGLQVFATSGVANFVNKDLDKACFSLCIKNLPDLESRAGLWPGEGWVGRAEAAGAEGANMKGRLVPWGLFNTLLP